MRFDENIINKVCELSRLELTPQEKQEFTMQLEDIIRYVEKINELDTINVQPADHIVPLSNVFRDDTVHESLPVQEVQKIAPQFEKNHFVVPRIIEEME
ncbi:MAG TPA: Asp-tRNA(Asn)/Glu-tRNA(Gln) amidotransferase subunit GatC [Spirochaetota bacterium]|nr:Asp-tRNA(Asn)/Glu-tRNA(Gln) amidotransferase subunit GatC [Spirochaetota bacterium]HRR61877.1 Asp-tRNA(Asn)/Glu-tRNA(Gln) amidotransferase subunit GatC [Spirochaetota bacterium]HRV15891.1 Asp-tRNA(Asn)/Glu-tRNA(Gln) amidotransferase subunit GatC [Spirochaetota bacterium]